MSPEREHPGSNPAPVRAKSMKMSTNDTLYRLTAAQVLTKVWRGEVTVEDWANSLLARIDQRDDMVGAWAYLDRERVIKEARRLDEVPMSERGPLHGVPVAIKDVIYTEAFPQYIRKRRGEFSVAEEEGEDEVEGSPRRLVAEEIFVYLHSSFQDMPTKHNSPLYQDSFPQVDAASVIMLRGAGALIFGKTTTTQFAAILCGPKTYNPHSLPPLPIRTPGGSSSGSGASVGDFQIPVALGTQTGGSTIRPASYNGIYCIKPTWGAVSREGQKLYSITLDTIGIYARGVEDLELLAEGFGVWDDETDPTLPKRPAQSRTEEVDAKIEQDDEKREKSGELLTKESYENQRSSPTEFLEGEMDVRGKKFALCKTMMWPKAGTGTRKAVEKAAALLRDHGAIVEDIDLPSEFDSLPIWYHITLYTEGRQAFFPDYVRATKAVGKTKYLKKQMNKAKDRVRGLESELIDEQLVGHVENMHGFTKKQQLDAFDGIARLRPRMDEILSGYAALLTPSAIDEAPLGINFTGSSEFCSNWTTLHTPVVNIPGFQGENGLPIGVSMVAGRYRDRHLLRVCKAVGQIFEAEGGWKRNL